MTTLEKLRKYNETGEALTHALKDWPSHPSAPPTWLKDPLEDDDASQETSYSNEVVDPLWQLKVHFRNARKAVPATFGLTLSRKKRNLVKAIKEAQAALTVEGDLKEVKGMDFYEDGMPGNHSKIFAFLMLPDWRDTDANRALGDVAIFLNNLSTTIERELIKVLKNSRTKDYGDLTKRTRDWAVQVRTKLMEALELRREFMRRSREQFNGAKIEVSALILEKFRWGGDTVSNFVW
jgi:hypothetical protein